MIEIIFGKHLDDNLYHIISKIHEGLPVWERSKFHYNFDPKLDLTIMVKVENNSIYYAEEAIQFLLTYSKNMNLLTFHDKRYNESLEVPMKDWCLNNTKHPFTANSYPYKDKIPLIGEHLATTPFFSKYNPLEKNISAPFAQVTKMGPTKGNYLNYQPKKYLPTETKMLFETDRYLSTHGTHLATGMGYLGWRYASHKTRLPHPN